MFLQAFEDLLKPQWLMILKVLKTAGGMPISDLSRETGVSYMTLKQHCEALTKKGYLMRSRLPKTGIGRPEIFYRLAEKAEAMFPSSPPDFNTEIFSRCRQLFGETAPEKLLFHYYAEKELSWGARVDVNLPLPERLAKFVGILEKEGILMKVISDEEGRTILRQFHHPLAAIFDEYGRAVQIELRVMEAVLSASLRREVEIAAGGSVRWIDFDVVER